MGSSSTSIAKRCATKVKTNLTTDQEDSLEHEVMGLIHNKDQVQACAKDAALLYLQSSHDLAKGSHYCRKDLTIVVKLELSRSVC